MADDVTARRAARVIVLDARGRVLLLHGRDPARPEAGTWWVTPGGGVDDGESLRDAARRELREETGLDVEITGSVLLERHIAFDFEGQRYDQHEHFFTVRVDAHDVTDTQWTEIEQRALLGHRWWTRAELAVTDDTVFPEMLVALLDEILGEA